jgi:general transcription factor 3C polypeptide 3 (transcription factor C subunit 4)
VEQARKLISTHQFNNEPYRILLASLAPGMRSTDAFIASTLQKHVIREIRLGDVAVKNPDALKWRELSKRWVLIQGATEGRAADGEEPLETELVDDDPQEDAAEAGDDKRGPTVPTHGLPTKDNPMIVAIYGQICIAAKSYQSAICE